MKLHVTQHRTRLLGTPESSVHSVCLFVCLFVCTTQSLQIFRFMCVGINPEITLYFVSGDIWKYPFPRFLPPLVSPFQYSYQPPHQSKTKLAFKISCVSLTPFPSRPSSCCMPRAPAPPPQCQTPSISSDSAQLGSILVCRH